MKAAVRLRQHLGVPGTAAVTVLLLAVLGAGALVVTHSAASRPAAASHRTHHRAHVPGAAHRTKPSPVRIVSITPREGASDVAFQPHIAVRFSQPLSSESPLPSLSPALPGTWVRATDEEVFFETTANFAPYTKVTVSVPGGAGGVVSADGGRMRAGYEAHFSVGPGSTLRLQQLLAELGYMPVNFTPTPSAAPTTTGRPSSSAGGGPAGTPPVAKVPAGPSGPPGSGTVLTSAPATPAAHISEPARPADIPLAPVSGTFSWRYDNIPGSLRALWTPGQENVVTQGAVMAFENDHGLSPDGQAGPLVWSALLKAVAARQVDRFGYDYVYVSTGSPEYVDLWRNGKVIFQTLANTGIPQAPTQAGTWPVYVRYLTTTMSGTNPDGSHYSDPGIPWVSYFHGGDALHGFIRSQYGFPQSLGCVEMPYSSAKVVYPYTPIGTLVTVG